MLRRRIKGDLAILDQGDPEQLRLSFPSLTEETVVYEYAVLVTSLPHEILSVGPRPCFPATPVPLAGDSIGE